MDFSEHGQDTSNKFIGIFVVIVVHAVVIYALLHGLGKQIIAVVKELPIEAKVIQEVKPTPPPDAPPPPKLEAPPPPFIPPPEVVVEQQVLPSAIQVVSMEGASHANFRPPAAAGPPVVKPVVDFSTCDKPEYPRNALRNEEHGTVRLQFLIGLDGRVTDSRIEKSSGSRMLDNAARVALSLCKFRPGTIDGKVQQSWASVDYVWKLPD